METTYIRRSLFTRCSEAATSRGFSFEQRMREGHIVYVVNGKEMTPGEAANYLNV